MKLNVFILYTIFIAISLTTKAQCFDEDDIFQKPPKTNTKDSVKAVKLLNHLLINGYNKSTYNKFINNTYNGEYPLIKGEIIHTFWDNYKEATNQALCKKVNNMQLLDQAFRHFWCPDDECIDWHKIKQIDSANQLELIKMAKKNGKLPGKKEIGWGMYDVLLMLRHVGDSNNFNFFHPLIVQQAKDGDFPFQNVASAIDYYWLREKVMFVDSVHFYEMQLYGTVKFPIKENKNILVPVRNWEETEQLRKEIGLPSLKQELQQDTTLIYNEELYKQLFTKRIKK